MFIIENYAINVFVKAKIVKSHQHGSRAGIEKNRIAKNAVLSLSYPNNQRSTMWMEI